MLAMSQALDYLAQARPDAMGHYFRFLKQCGQHLDPKTRSLISVIAKVHAQTDRGLRQYLKRALQAGCTPAEVIDALLVAFPILGLSRILWAVDVILAMQLPGFDLDALRMGVGNANPPATPPEVPAQGNAVAIPEQAGASAHWRDLVATADVPLGATVAVPVGEQHVFVHHSSGEFLVYDGRCPHMDTPMDGSHLDGHLLTCPRHGWTFDVRSGACIRTGQGTLRRHESRVVDGRVQARC
jgi:nitrite reductase/ring-hydroxylating ferredoxin subunit/alkylhydroperoxidase/carboxymuconolactone decarboxylase family protein YurZ